MERAVHRRGGGGLEEEVEKKRNAFQNRGRDERFRQKACAFASTFVSVQRENIRYRYGARNSPAT